MPESNIDDPVEIRQTHPADLADRLQRMPNEAALDTLAQLPEDLAAETMVELDREKFGELAETLSAERLGQYLAHLSHQDAADLLGELPTDDQHEVLQRIAPEHATRVRALLSYPEDSAGGIMSDRFICLRENQTVGECQEYLRTRSEEYLEDVSYLYVTDHAGKLIGIVSLRDLVFRRPDRHISEIMNPDVAYVPADADQEEIARQFEHYGYLGLPVLDKTGRLVGVVKASDVFKVAQEEATEDMQLMVGLSGEERALTPWFKSVGRRLPWLYVNLATAFLAAFVVGLFEGTIAKWTALAIFLPIIAGQGGNAGMQTLTVIIRDLALGEISLADGWRALAKEFMLGLINGAAVGLVVGLIGYWWKGSVVLGLVAGCAMLLNQVAAALSGVMIPFGLKLLRVDPALASSIFLTTVTDVAGFFFFLGLASLTMAWVGM